MRMGRTGGTCGDDLGPCDSPADACAPGWHVCCASGAVADLKARVTAQQCNSGAGAGRFYAGISHCSSLPTSACVYDPSVGAVYPCGEKGYCSESVCCGTACLPQSCSDGVWSGATRGAYDDMSAGCAATTGTNAGVLCCRD
jgi:hypothetical protein